MTAQLDISRAAQMQMELSGFLTKYVDDPQVGWPRRAQPGPRRFRRSQAKRTRQALRILVVGELCIDVTADVGTTVANLTGDGSKTRALGAPWRLTGVSVGGFLAQAAAIAASLGAEVYACTTVPVPTPGQFDAFLAKHSVNRQFVTAVPGRASFRLVCRCLDGEAILRTPSAATVHAVELPAASLACVDAIVIDPSPRNPIGLASSLSPLLDSRFRDVAIGVRADDHWANEEFAAVRDARVWTFVRHRDARRLVRRVCGERIDADDRHLATRLHDSLGIGKLVLHFGPRGAMLLNGIPCPYRVHTCPLHKPGLAHGGAALMTVTTMSSALGADDRTSLRRGVAAATGCVAGLELPRTMEELDVA